MEQRLAVRPAALLTTIVALLAGIVLATGSAQEAPPSTEGATLSPAETARRAGELARVGDVAITVGDVEDEINAMSPFVRARYRDPNRLREYVENMIQLELLAREADARGYGDDPEVRRSTLESAVQHMIRTDIDERITASSIPEADVLVYYDAHPEEFSRPEMRRASHILLESREAADAAIERARGGDMRSFRALAQELSADTETRTRGGDLRYFDAQGRGPNTADPAVDAAIATATFALGAVGDLSEPIDVGEGRFSVIKLTGLRPAEHRSVADASDAIRMRLFRQRREEALDSLVERLRASVPTEVHYERMANLRMEPAPTTGSFDSEHASEEEGGEAEGETEPLRAPPIDPVPALGEDLDDPTANCSWRRSRPRSPRWIG